MYHANEGIANPEQIAALYKCVHCSSLVVTFAQLKMLIILGQKASLQEKSQRSIVPRSV